jgi:hypothetical protein
VIASRKYIVEKLLSGHYLRSWHTHGGVPCYRLYDQEGNPIRNIRQDTVDRMDRKIDPQIRIWRVVPKGKIVFNLSAVRRLHGNNYIKKQYNKLKV